MGGKLPIGILMDQCKAMRNAIEKSLPMTRHRWCIWHITKKISEKLGACKQFNEICADMTHIVWDSRSKEAFKSSWTYFINRFSLHDNNWLVDLYEERDRWVPIFLSNSFWFQKEYTHAKFNELQTEFRAKANCFSTKEHEERYVVTYKVIEEIENGNKMFDVTYKVSFDSSTSDVSCQCHLFESKGILCRHTLSVLGLERVKKLPNKYFLDRWKKTLKRKHSSIKCSHDPSRLEPIKKRYDEMCKQFYNIAEVVAASEELTETVHRILDSVWVILVEPKASSMDNVDNQNLNEVDENANNLEIHNPQQVSRKGGKRKKKL
nr:protein FAR-RED IMPAIRED RESPONSE 1-like [Arachis hypogaea]